MFTYCIITFSSGNHFINSEKQVDWHEQLSNDFLEINGGKRFINRKNISDVVRIDTYREFIELAEGQRIRLSEFEHLRNLTPPPPPPLDQNTFTSLPARDEPGNDENNDD